MGKLTTRADTRALAYGYTILLFPLFYYPASLSLAPLSRSRRSRPVIALVLSGGKNPFYYNLVDNPGSRIGAVPGRALAVL